MQEYAGQQAQRFAGECERRDICAPPYHAGHAEACLARRPVLLGQVHADVERHDHEEHEWTLRAGSGVDLILTPVETQLTQVLSMVETGSYDATDTQHLNA